MRDSLNRPTMLTSNRFAFKEWAVNCAALAEGRQSLLLRKGGIHERNGRFEVEHNEFWLFPTRFHQNPDELREEHRALLDSIGQEPAGTVPISLYAVVEEAIQVRDETLLPRLTELQILAGPTVSERFHYSEPGLFVVLVRICKRAETIPLADSPHFAGCRTWVDLGRDLPTEGLRPVLSDADRMAQFDAVRRALGIDL